MEISSQLHAPAPLPLVKEPLPPFPLERTKKKGETGKNISSALSSHIIWTAFRGSLNSFRDEAG
jgi:hypothetical protein